MKYGLKHMPPSCIDMWDAQLKLWTSFHSILCEFFEALFFTFFFVSFLEGSPLICHTLSLYIYIKLKLYDDIRCLFKFPNHYHEYYSLRATSSIICRNKKKKWRIISNCSMPKAELFLYFFFPLLRRIRLKLSLKNDNLNLKEWKKCECECECYTLHVNERGRKKWKKKSLIAWIHGKLVFMGKR